MGVTEIMREIDTLPAPERWQVLEHTRHTLEADVPDSFQQAMREITAGNTTTLDEALLELNDGS
jgi:hypothetical protein